MSLITIEDLMNNKKKLDNSKEKTINIFSEELGGEIKARIPRYTELMEILEEKLSIDEQADKIIYYNSIEPDFSDDKLITAMKCNSKPYSVVSKVISEETRIQLANVIMQETLKKGSIVKLADDIKN